MADRSEPTISPDSTEHIHLRVIATPENLVLALARLCAAFSNIDTGDIVEVAGLPNHVRVHVKAAL